MSKMQYNKRKKNGCNHITCNKCGYQWYWLCNEEYNENHFKKGKWKEFQFFQPKNDYEIKLIMEGKINYNELSKSQRQFDENLNDLSENEQNIYDSVECIKKAYWVFFFMIFGNCYFILKGFDLLDNILVLMIYILLSFCLFF